MRIQRFVIIKTSLGCDAGQTGPVDRGASIATSRIPGITECFCKEAIASDIFNELTKGSEALGFPAAVGGEERHGDLLVQGVAIDVVDPSVLRRRVPGRDPGDVAVEEENHVGVFSAPVKPEAEAFRGDVRGGETHVAPAGIVHADTGDQIRQRGKERRRPAVAPGVSRDDKRALCPDQRGRNVAHGIGRERAGPDRHPLRLVERIRPNLLGQDLPRGSHVHRALGRAVRELQRPRDRLLDVQPRPYFPRIPAVLPHEGLLIGRVLQPMHVFRAGAQELPRFRERAQAGEDEDRRASDTGVVHALAQSLRADVDVDEDSRRPSGYARMPVDHGNGGDLGRTCDDPGPGSRPLPLTLHDSLDDGWVVRPDIHEAFCDTRLVRFVSTWGYYLVGIHSSTHFPERLKQGKRGSVSAPVVLKNRISLQQCSGDQTTHFPDPFREPVVLGCLSDGGGVP